MPFTTAKVGGTPLAMENMWADFRVVFGEEFSRLLVECDEAGRVGGGNVGMRPVLAVGCAGVKNVVLDEHGAIGRVVREYTEFVHHVIDPDDVGVARAGFDGWGLAFGGFAAIQHHVLHTIIRLVFERAVVPVGHAVHVETHHFATARDNINAVAFDRR